MPYLDSMWSVPCRASLLWASVLVGLAGCDSNEPVAPLSSIEVIAPSDTVAFYFSDGARIASRAWFRSANGAPVTVSVEVDHDSLTWDTNTGRLLAASPTTDVVRVTGSAEGHRDTTVTVLAVAYGPCPPSWERDDYFPLVDRAVWTFDYYRRDEDRFRVRSVHGTLSLKFGDATCERGIRTVEAVPHIVGTEKYLQQGGGGDREGPVEYSLNLIVFVESPDNEVQTSFPSFAMERLDRYQSLGGGDLVFEGPRWRSTTLQPTVGISSVDIDVYFGFGTYREETWTRR
ncbi:MAG: hypothetical protein AAF170_04855 [Bacteroidota bacterium]